MNRRSMFTLLFIGILLASCAPSADGQPTPDIKGTIDANAQTMVAALFQTQTALAPAATNTPLPTITSLPTSTALALPTSTTGVQQPIFVAATATPTGTYYTATPLASSLGVGCKNLRLVGGYTTPEGPFLPGQDFTQSWQVENNGTCDWMYVYAWVFVSGDKLGQATSVRLSKQIPPGKWTTLSVNMHAPDKAGTYKASWRLTDGSTPFGAPLPVNITVGGPTNTPKPDTAATSAAQTVAAGVAQTSAAAAQQTAVQAAINTAVAGTANANATNAAAAAQTAVCAQTPAANPAPNPPCIVP